MEAAIVREARPGADVDVGRLVLGHLDDAYRLARAILLDDHEAEDAVQEASLLAWRQQRALRDPNSFGAWFDRILINHCRDRLRKRRRAVQIGAPPIGFEPAAPPPDTGMDADLDRAVDALDPDHRIVVLLRYWQDRTVDDIALRVGIPSGTVKSRLHHALRAIRTSLEASHGRS
jgi:RNA polymerase sigma-70 factor (ECF subfamily)